MIRLGDVEVAAGELSAEAAAAIVARRVAELAAPAAAARAGGDPVLVWSLGEDRYGTAVADVWETIVLPHVTRVPEAPPALAGVFARRGVVHNLFDPAAVLGGAAQTGGHALVLRRARPRLALRIDAVVAIVAVPASDGPPAAARHAVAEDGSHLTLLDTAQLLARLGVRPRSTEG